MFKINNKDTTTTPTWKVSYDEVTYRRYHLPWSVSTIVVGQFLKGCNFTSRHFFVQSQDWNYINKVLTSKFIDVFVVSLFLTLNKFQTLF